MLCTKNIHILYECMLYRVVTQRWHCRNCMRLATNEQKLFDGDSNAGSLCYWRRRSLCAQHTVYEYNKIVFFVVFPFFSSFTWRDERDQVSLLEQKKNSDTQSTNFDFFSASIFLFSLPGTLSQAVIRFISILGVNERRVKRTTLWKTCRTKNE